MRRLFSTCVAVCGLMLGATFDAGSQAPGAFGEKIVRGTRIDIQDRPWQATLRITYSDGLSGYCGGAVIAKHWIVTAAHCLVDAVKVKVKVGVTDISHGRWVEAQDFIVQEKFDAKKFDDHPALAEHDSALVYVASFLPATAIPLADFATPIAIDEDLRVAGHGNRSERGKKSDELLEAVVPYIDTRHAARH